MTHMLGVSFIYAKYSVNYSCAIQVIDVILRHRIMSLIVTHLYQSPQVGHCAFAISLPLSSKR